jgi:hypothetical protein
MFSGNLSFGESVVKNLVDFTSEVCSIFIGIIFSNVGI